MPDIPAKAPRESRDGRIVTFYSYKGGTGRTMALANVGWILAASGYRVLVADWDLESPGLHRFFHPFLGSEVEEGPGIVNLIHGYEQAAAGVGDRERREKLIPALARVEAYAFSLKWDHFSAGGDLQFLSSGRQNRDYGAALAALDWDTFYDSLNGGEFLDAVGEDMRRNYDYVLIDSRTGWGDVSDICTVQLPDVLVDCFTLSIQGMEGAARVAKDIGERSPEREIRILPVPMRVDQAEKDKVEAGHAQAARLFSGLPAGLSDEQRREYWSAVEVPYQPWYSYEETLAVFGDPPGFPGSLLSSFERIAAQITDGKVTGLAPMDEQLRNRTKLRFTRRPQQDSGQIIVESGPEDQVWGEWIAGVLRSAGITVRERGLDEDPGTDGENPPDTRKLAVVSAAYLTQNRAQSSGDAEPDLAVYVTVTRPPAELAGARSVFLVGLPEKEATERLHRLVGVSGWLPEADPPEIRYPGAEPKIFRAPVRNARFTGRENDLRQLREELRRHGTTVVLPVALQGLGGVGKTQLAMEYVHRFKSDYDLVWWLDCGQPQFIDASLADLGTQMGEDFEISVPVTANAGEASRQVLQFLAQGQAAPRWLLVFDNADDLSAVREFVPSGGGHILVTSRNRGWADQAQVLPVDTFSRPESVLHLRQRAPAITEAEADKVAEELGDLPLAVASAGAWLAETGLPVAEYLAELKRQPVRVLSAGQFDEYPRPVSQTWDVSLNRLQDRSPAAARLLELCSVMAPRIATRELLYSEATARVLVPFDPSLSETMVVGRLIQEINRLALIKLDPTAGRLHVHRLVQAVVQDRMKPEQIESARQDVHRVLAAARPRGEVDDPDTWQRFRVIWPHLAPSQAVRSREEAVRQLFVDRVRYIWLRHDLDRGRETAAEVEQAWEQMLAAEQDRAVADALRRQLLQLRFNLGNILRDQAEFEEARLLDEAVLGEQQRVLGTEHPHTLMTAGAFAADLRALGRYQEALTMDQKTYPAWMELYGDDHPRTLAAANNLAVSCRLSGDISHALHVDENTLERRRGTLGPLHPRTMSSALNVARDLLEAGRYNESAERMEVVRRLCIETFGEDSLDALNADVILGIALRRAGHPMLAEPHLMRASDGFTRRLGSSSSEALACRLSRAVNLLSLERAAEAEAEILQVLAVYQHRLGPSHPHTLTCRVDLAAAVRAADRQAEALPMARAAATGLHEALGDEHPSTLTARVAVGVLLADRGDLAAAEEVEARAAEDLMLTLGPDHPDALRCRANLLLTQHQRGAREAIGELAEVADLLAALIGADHPDIRNLRTQRRLMPVLDPHPF